MMANERKRIAAILTSFWRIVERGRRLETPHLHIPYRAREESLFNRGPMPPADDDFGIGP